MFVLKKKKISYKYPSVAPRCAAARCYNGGTCYEHSPASSIFGYCLCK